MPENEFLGLLRNSDNAERDCLSYPRFISQGITAPACLLLNIQASLFRALTPNKQAREDGCLHLIFPGRPSGCLRNRKAVILHTYDARLHGYGGDSPVITAFWLISVFAVYG